MSCVQKAALELRAGDTAYTAASFQAEDTRIPGVQVPGDAPAASADSDAAYDGPSVRKTDSSSPEIPADAGAALSEDCLLYTSLSGARSAGNGVM